MLIDAEQINQHNKAQLDTHQRRYDALLVDNLVERSAERLISLVQAFQVAIPSWALGTGGTRFGRFPGGGEPRFLEEKLDDVGLLHALNRNSGSISLHIPWDIPTDYESIRMKAAQHGLRFDAVNSNTFQDAPGAAGSYKFGSLQHVERAVRDQSIAHNTEVIRHGNKLGAKALTVWLADGSAFPGQASFRGSFERTLSSLKVIYEALPSDWKLFIEYKAYEPNFYSSVVADWGQSLLFASKLGAKAFTLVDLGHHLPGTNIEQIVALLLMEGKLGGFHFNDSKYGDDDLTVGSLQPYQLFLIFGELVEGMNARSMDHAELGWMIDASHNVKDPLEDLLQSVEAILLAYAAALLVDRSALSEARSRNDVVEAQEILQSAFRTDLRPIVAEARLRSGGALDPLALFRSLGVRTLLQNERGNVSATGL